MKAIYKRELQALMSSRVGWLYLFGLLAVGSVAAILYNLFNQFADFSNALAWNRYAYIALIPLLASYVFAGNRSVDRLLRSLPVKPCAVVGGKYLACLTIHTLSCAILFLYPVALHFFGDISLKATLCSFIGFWALGAALIAFCAVPSVLSKGMPFGFLRSAALAAVLCFLSEILSLLAGTAVSNPVIMIGMLVAVVAVFYWISGSLTICLVAGLLFEAPVFLSRLNMGGIATFFSSVLESVALFSHSVTFSQGILDVRQILYFLVASVVALALTTAAYMSKRISERRARA